MLTLREAAWGKDYLMSQILGDVYNLTVGDAMTVLLLVAFGALFVGWDYYGK
jgi:hypothetical protein